jgi:hypothetical protein
MAFDDMHASVERCCGTNCSATEIGHFLHFGGSEGPDFQSNASFLALLSCGRSPSFSGTGSVTTERPRSIECTNTNFTACGGPRGAAVYAKAAESKCNCRYLTVVFCGGDTGFE